MGIFVLRGISYCLVGKVDRLKQTKFYLFVSLKTGLYPIKANFWYTQFSF